MALNQLFKQLPVIRGKLSPQMADGVKFLDWYEEMFLRMIKKTDTREDE
jgi:hypothetical protein